MPRRLAGCVGLAILLLAPCIASALPPAGAPQPAPQEKLDAAAERKLLDEALMLIRDKKYIFAVAKLAPLTRSQSLPDPVTRVIPGLIADLQSLNAVTQLAAGLANGKLPAVTADVLSPAVKQPYAWLQVLRDTSNFLETPLPPGTVFPLTAAEANKLLDALAVEFDPELLSRLRLELSAKLFLVGKPQEASELLKNETPGEYAREVLADLRTIILGGGTLVNPQVARFVPEKGLSELPGAAVLVPVSLRDKWQRPKPPTATETTLAKLEKLAREQTAIATTKELARLTKKVTATAESIRR